MFRRLNDTLNSLFGTSGSPDRDGSVEVTDDAVIEAFVSDPENSFLVSFPRTGSHWLRMLMELYFKRPSLARIFFYPEQTNYLTLHTHDLELDVQRDRVLYLYREPVATIYSQMQYHEEDLDDTDRIAYWSRLYGRHLQKWLVDESFTDQKTLIRYACLKSDLNSEFPKICRHFSADFDPERLASIAEEVSKQRVNERVKDDDPNVINLGETYEERRERFRKEKGDMVRDFVFGERHQVRTHFHDPSA
jgi:hypothetical protein